MTKTYAESKVEMEKTNIISDPNDVLWSLKKSLTVRQSARSGRPDMRT